MRKLLLVAALGLSVSAQAGAADYLIDTKGGHAAINFKYKHLGISWLTGSFNTFGGMFNYDPENIAATRITVDVNPLSLDSNHAERDKHIKSDDFLDVSKYAKAKFVSTSVTPNGDGKALVTGDLTLHGETNEIIIDASIVGAGDDPWGGYRVGFEGTTIIDTTAFGFQMPPENKVYMDLVIEGVRQ
ncbi:MAG: polyisoprenoid-binding protein YceI [Candidatus Azotimanducaceae bacterium]|jgi:polyisoprenoid-binding protein YceI